MIGDLNRFVTAGAECFNHLRHPLQTISLPLLNELPLYFTHVQKNCIIKNLCILD